MTGKLKFLLMFLLLMFISEKASAIYQETITTSTTHPPKGTSAVVTFQKNGGSNDPTTTKDDCVMLYAKGTITIEPNKDYVLTKIDYYYKIKKNYYAPSLQIQSEGTLKKTSFGSTWTGKTSKPIVLLVKGGKGSFVFSQVIITYDLCNNKQNTYTLFPIKKFNLNLDNDNYKAFKGQQAKTTPYELPLVYSSNNEKVATVNVKTGEVSLNHTLGIATIKSSFSGNDTLNASADNYTITVYPYNDGTENHPYTVEEIYKLRDAAMYSKEGDFIYVHGYITKIKSLTNGIMTYYISDNTSAKKQLLVDAKNINETDFKSKDNLSIGWFVTIKGRNKVVNSEPQIVRGCITQIIKNNISSPHIFGSTSFLDSTSVTLSSENQDAKIYYTIDGTEPTDQSTVYTAPFSLNASTSVKAVAYINGEKSKMASQYFKKVEENELISVAQALKTADNTQVYIKAKVAKTEIYNSSSPTLNYYIADNENAGETLEILNGRYLQNNKISNAFQIVRGDEVVVAATVNTDNGHKTLKNANLLSIKEYQDQAKVTTAGWATFVSRRAVDFSKNNDISAYLVKYNDSDNRVTLTPVTVIPGNTAVVVKANAGTYELQRSKENTTIVNNDLKFYNNSKKVTKALSFYVLSKQGNGCGFYPVKVNDTIAPFKGFLTVNTASTVAAKPFYAIGNTTTGIINTMEENKNVEDMHYNLAGQRVDNNYKGLVIVNGHKVIRK